MSVSLANGAEFFNDWVATHLSSVTSESGPTNDPDHDGAANLTEFVFGTDPVVSDISTDAVVTLFGGTSGFYGVEIFERAGHRPGVQIDLDVTADMVHWIRPWWLRTATNSLPGDPTNSVREVFITYLPTTSVFIVRGRIHLVEAGPEAATYYVATNGSDSASGTSTNTPFRSLFKAHSVANPGNLIYIRGGTYTTNAVLTINRNGTAANPIRLRAYPGEHPILDFSPQTFSSGNRGIQLQASWWRIHGLEIAGAGDNGMNITGKSNVVELCVFHDNRDTGLQITGPGASNLVLNCDSYHNNDDISEDADGFAPKLAGLGKDNAFRGCRAWENADDGWDMYQAPNPVYIENCWSFRNGHYGTNGDRNGFKLGGSGVGASHHLVNCVSFHNPHHGYDQNNNTLPQTLDNCTAWANGAAAGGSGENFNLNHGPVVAHILRNNLSIDGTIKTNTISILISNSWQVVTSPAASTNDVLSTDEAYALFPRRDDGGLPEVPFLRPVVGGRLVDKGADLSEPFAGPAPDLGAYETLVW
jgi:Pel9A-like, right handed beta helix region